MSGYRIKEGEKGFFIEEPGKNYIIPLEKRIFDFVIAVIKYLRTIQKSTINNVIVYQLTKASTSVGANYEEAQGASSKKDFIAKAAIAHREAKEANYWLRIIKGSDLDTGSDLDFLIQESKELRNILGRIVGNARKNSEK